MTPYVHFEGTGILIYRQCLPQRRAQLFPNGGDELRTVFCFVVSHTRKPTKRTCYYVGTYTYCIFNFRST